MDQSNKDILLTVLAALILLLYVLSDTVPNLFLSSSPNSAFSSSALAAQTEGDILSAIAGGNSSQTYYIYIPPNFNSSKTYPLVVGLHGGGQPALRVMSAWENAADTYNMILLFPQSPNPLGWFNYYTADNFTISAISAVKQQYKVGNILLTGCSNGARFDYIIALLNPHLFTAVAPMVGAMSGYTFSAGELSNSIGQQFYIVAGLQDQEVGIGYMYNTSNTLKEAGANVTLRVLNMSHICPSQVATNVTKWFLGLG